MCDMTFSVALIIIISLCLPHVVFMSAVMYAGMVCAVYGVCVCVCDVWQVWH